MASQKKQGVNPSGQPDRFFTVFFYPFPKVDRGYDFVWQVLKLSSIEEFVGRDLFSFRYGAAVARFPAVFILGAVIICILKNYLKQRNTIFPFGKFTHPLSNNEVSKQTFKKTNKQTLQNHR